MLAAKPKPILIIASLLVVLALLSGTSALTNRLGFARTRQPGAFSGNNAQGGNFQGNNGNTDPGGNAQNGNGGNFQGGNGNNGNFQARGGGNNALGSIFRVLGPSFIYISIGITVLGIILTLLSAYGVWKQKKWGLNLAMVLALLFLIAALPGLFSLGGRNINLLRTSITILNVIASAPILVLGILPSVRDFVS
jgi:ABC-type glycerol-3-phosphate transport system permease component